MRRRSSPSATTARTSTTKNNLIATHHTVDEIAKIIGVNSLGYLSIEDVVKLADNTENGFCTACFGGGYPTSIPKDGGKDRFECKISEGEKKRMRSFLRATVTPA